MRIHGTCPDCGKAFDCLEVLTLYQGYGIRVADGLQCGCCAAEAVGLNAASGELIYDFCCVSCAGTVGSGRLSDMLDQNHSIPGNVGYIAAGDAYWLSLREGEADDPMVWVPNPIPTGMRIRPRAGTRTPAPRAAEIVLAAGEKKCYCNKCERLVVVTGIA